MILTESLQLVKETLTTLTAIIFCAVTLYSKEPLATNRLLYDTLTSVEFCVGVKTNFPEVNGIVLFAIVGTKSDELIRAPYRSIIDTVIG